MTRADTRTDCWNLLELLEKVKGERDRVGEKMKKYGGKRAKSRDSKGGIS